MDLNEKIESGFTCGGSAAGGKFARPGAKPSYGPDQEFDAEHILLELELDLPKKSVYGKCSTTFRAIHDGAREIRFDAVNMKIRSVSNAAGERLSHIYKDGKLTVKPRKASAENDTVTVCVAYTLVKPIAGVYFIEPDRHYPDKPVQVWTHGEAEESRYWFPCFDAPHDKAVTEMIAAVPRDFFALSNGALLSVKDDKKRGKKVYHWKQAIPHSPYLVTLVAGKFSEIKQEWDGIPITYYCEPGREAEAKRAFGKTPKMVKFFSESIGVRYPYEKYAQIAVADFVRGGMEHTTATTQTDRVLMDERAYPEFNADWLVSHELAHQWFGDLLTCKEWGHAWLNESFATYFEALFTEHDLGREEFQYEMREKLHQYLDEDKNVYRRPIVTHVYKKPDDLFDRHLYEKGSLVLHTLRHLLGNKLFWKAIRFYVETYSAQAVETADLIHSIQSATGKNFRRFFDQYVFGPGHPDYTVQYGWDDKAKEARVRVLQKPVNSGSYFLLPVVLRFITAGGPKDYTVRLDDKEHSFKYKFSKEPLDFRFDPDHGILKTAEVTKPYRMWLHGLRTDPHPVGRIAAAEHIAKVPAEESLDALKRAFAKEKFWGSAKEMAASIGSMKTEGAKKFLLQALRSAKNPKVRRGVVEGLGNFADSDAVSALARTARSDRSYFVAAEAVRAASKTRSPLAARVIVQALERKSWNDTIRAAAVSTLSAAPDKRAFEALRRHSRYGANLSSRISGVQAMGRLAKNFPEFFDDLIRFTQDSQVRLKHAAISALGGLKDPRAIKALEKIKKAKALPYRTQALAEDALLKITPPKNS